VPHESATPEENIAMEYDVKFIPRMYFLDICANTSGTITKAGPVAVWNHTKNEWSRKFLALRQPYLYLYSSQSEQIEEAVISIFATRLDHGERISEMLRVIDPVGPLTYVVTQRVCDLHEL
jgi:hypothetical protein